MLLLSWLAGVPLPVAAAVFDMGCPVLTLVVLHAYVEPSFDSCGGSTTDVIIVCRWRAPSVKARQSTKVVACHLFRSMAFFNSIRTDD